MLGEIAHGIDEAQRGAAVTGIKIAGNNGPGPAADARQHGDVLFAVRTAVSDGLTDDARAHLKLPERLACTGVYRFEPTVHSTVEDHIPRRGQRPAPDGEVFLDAPDFAGRDRVPGAELPTV